MSIARGWSWCGGWVRVGLAVWLLLLPGSTGAVDAAGPTDAVQDVPRPVRVGVLSSAKEPRANTSQGLYLKILRNAGMQARAVSGEDVRNGALDELDVFIIGGGSGTKFNESLGPDGGKAVEAFVRRGGGALASCAGGYSFVRGHNEALKFVEIANARCIDTQNGRWARGSGVVELAADDAAGTPLTSPLKMFYANGPLWEITEAEGFGVTRAVARFAGDIKKGDDPGGVMPGTPAILAGTFGSGRYVLFSGHPEFRSSLGNNPLVVDAARWVTRGPLAAEEPVTFRAIFPSVIASDAVPPAGP